MKTKIDMLEERIDGIERTMVEIKSMLSGRAQVETVPVVGKESSISAPMKRKINDIMRHFDFERVHKVMETLDWKWGSAKNADGIPTIDEIMTEAKRILIDSAIEEQTLATGGFRATYEKGDDSDTPFLSLEFIVTDWEGFDDDDEDTDDWDE